MWSRIQLQRYTGGVVLRWGAEYSYTGILGAWYLDGKQNTVTQVYRGVVLRWGAEYSYTGILRAWYFAGE